METKDGNVNVVEPVVPEASEPAGVDTKIDVQPDTNQSGGKAPEGATKDPQPSWLAQLPKDLKDDEELMQLLSKNPTIGDFVRASVKQDGTKGEGGAGEKEPLVYENFEKRFGVESDPFGRVSESLKTRLESLNVPMAEAEKLFDLIQTEQEATMAEFIEKGVPWCENELRTLWGDNYEKQRKAVTRGTQALMKADPELMKELDKTGASINPAVARVIAIYGNAIKEDGSVRSNESSTGTNRNPRVPVNYPD